METMPEVEKIVTETIDDKLVHKHLYADGSYGVMEGKNIIRYFPDGKKQSYEASGDKYILRSEQLLDGTKRSWYKNGQMSLESLPDGTKRSWREDGQLAFEISSNGSQKINKKENPELELSLSRLRSAQYKYHGQEEEILPDGTKLWFDNGQLRKEERPDGTYREWYDNGQMSHEELPDGTEHSWYKNRKMCCERLSDGTWREWYENGNMHNEQLPDGAWREWYENGQMEKEKLSDGTYRSWCMDGQIIKEELPDGTKREWYSNGQMEKEILPDGTIRRWIESGVLCIEKLLDGTERWWEDGEKTEKCPDGSYRRWYVNGQIKYEHMPDGTETDYDEEGNVTYHATNHKDDTEVYLAKMRVEQRMSEEADKLADKILENDSEIKRNGFGEIVKMASKVKRIKNTGK